MQASVTLEMIAGLVPVRGDGAAWTLTAAKPPATSEVAASREELARMLGLPPDAIAGRPLWIDTGVDQLVIPIATPALVRAARPDAALLEQHAMCESRREAMAYLWARGEPDEGQPRGVGTRAQRGLGHPHDEAADERSEEPARAHNDWTVRFLFTLDGGVVEDPATGSACANLGGWMIATGQPLPVRATLRQGDAVKRPSRLGLFVDADRSIHVTGDVVELGRGVIEL